MDYLNAGDDSSTTIEESKERMEFDLNVAASDMSDVGEGDKSDDFDSSEHVKRRRKVGKKKRKGRKRRKQEEMREEEKGDESGNEEGLEIDFLGLQPGRAGCVGSKKNGKKRKKNGDWTPTLMWEIWEEEHEKWIDMNLTEDVDLDHHNEVVAETVDAPSNLIMPLLRYQKEWLAWALKQEESKIRGGILADEMGMGKTIQAIALVLSKQEISKKICEPKEILQSPGSSLDLPKIKCTLVICPVVAVLQWVNEIGRFTSKGSNKVLVYHGAKRGKSISQFSEYDFVITTYSIVEAEYRKNVMPPKQKCSFCGKLFHPQNMPIHLRYFCGPDAIKTNKQSKQQKKVSKLKLKISDPVEDKGGEKMKRSHQKPKKNCKQKKHKDFSPFMESSTNVEQGTVTRKSILHSVKWNRIILDEVSSLKSFDYIVKPLIL